MMLTQASRLVASNSCLTSQFWSHPLKRATQLRCGFSKKDKLCQDSWDRELDTQKPLQELDSMVDKMIQLCTVPETSFLAQLTVLSETLVFWTSSRVLIFPKRTSRKEMWETIKVIASSAKWPNSTSVSSEKEIGKMWSPVIRSQCSHTCGAMPTTAFPKSMCSKMKLWKISKSHL